MPNETRLGRRIQLAFRPTIIVEFYVIFLHHIMWKRDKATDGYLAN